MNNRQKRFFAIAREISHLSCFRKFHIGAVVVEGNRVISTGFNSNKTSPVQQKYNNFRYFVAEGCTCSPRLHAEIAALAPLRHKDVDWKNVSIYIYREIKSGELACARPCEACMRFINDLGIKTIYYTDITGYKKEKVIGE